MATTGDKQSTQMKRVRRPAKKSVARNVIVPSPETLVPEEGGTGTVTASTRRPSPVLFGSVSRRKVNAFLRQLIMLLEAGTPILKSLRTLEARSSGSLKVLIADITNHVEEGNPLWQALDRHPKEFSTVDVNLIKASEASGNLVPVLQRLVAYRERRELLRKRVQGAMLYPIILLIAVAGVFALITGFVIPQFKEMFDKLGQELPGYTVAVLAFADFIAKFWLIFVLVVVALVVIYYAVSWKSRRWRMRFDRMKLKIPVVGPILKRLAIVEMTRSMALLLKSGVSMMATLDLTRNTIHNQAVAHVVQNIRDSVERGEGIEPPLRDEPGLVPPVVTDMLVTGEESGQIEKISEQIADTYQEEVNIRVATIGDALVPIVTVFIGLVVGALAVALFWPLITMVSNIGASGL